MYTVLIADDSAVVRRVVRSLFEEENDWTILEATDGREAVEQAQRLRPDLVVLDYSMPLMNGLEAAVVIKRAQPRLPLILFTLHRNRILEKQAFEKGCSVVFSKVEDSSRLMEAARLLLKYGSGARLEPLRCAPPFAPMTSAFNWKV